MKPRLSSFICGCLAFLLTNAAKPASADEIKPLSSSALAEAAAAPDVQRALQLMHDPKRDAEVVALFMKAAERGNPVAETYLGYLSYMGHGLPQNDQIAAQWYQRAAVQGFLDAELRLGALYLNGRELLDGRGVDRDYQAAVEWLQHAADQGSVTAVSLIGETYMTQALNGDSAQIGLAREYLRRAAKMHDPWAPSLLCFSLKYFPEPEQDASCDPEPLIPEGATNNQGNDILNSDQIPRP